MKTSVLRHANALVNCVQHGVPWAGQYQCFTSGRVCVRTCGFEWRFSQLQIHSPTELSRSSSLLNFESWEACTVAPIYVFQGGRHLEYKISTSLNTVQNCTPDDLAELIDAGPTIGAKKSNSQDYEDPCTSGHLTPLIQTVASRWYPIIYCLGR